MMHVVTAANRSLYTKQLEEMHQLRWKYYIEERRWHELREMQEVEGLERDQYDDEWAVYLMAVDADGAVGGSMRLRPTHENSLLADRFAHLLEDPASFEPGPETWEVTRIIRRPDKRTKDYAVRFSTAAAMLEVALSRGVKRIVTGGDTFLMPSARKLWHHKMRILGLPTPFEEGELMAVEFTVDEEALRMVREAAGFIGPQMFEIPAPLPDRPHDPIAEERLAGLISTLPLERVAEVTAWLEQRPSQRAETETAS